MAKIKLCPPPFPPGVYSFICPGCMLEHYVYTQSKNPNGAQWALSGSLDNPTFSPSIDCKWGHFASGLTPEERSYYLGTGLGGRCHSFVQAGRIQFLADCTHPLAGQTLELPDIGPVRIETIQGGKL